MRSPRTLPTLVLATVVGLGLTATPPTWAAFGDEAAVSTGAFAAGTLEPVTGFTCANSGAGVTLSWNPQPDRSYWLQVPPGPTRQVSVITSQTSVRLVPGNFGLLQTGRYRASVTTLATPTGTWVSADAPELTLGLTLGLTVRCA